MNATKCLVAVLTVTALTLASGAGAQTSARGTNGDNVPAGETPLPASESTKKARAARRTAPDNPSGTSRASVKSEARAAEKSGTASPAGEAALPQTGQGKSRVGDKPDTAAGSDSPRADVKSETKRAQSGRKLQPAGEAPQPSAEAPKK